VSEFGVAPGGRASDDETARKQAPEEFNASEVLRDRITAQREEW